MGITGKAKIELTQNTVYNFLNGDMTFEDFSIYVNTSLEDLGDLFNHRINNLSQTAILEIADKYTKPLALRFDFCKVLDKKLLDKQIELLNKYNVPLEQREIMNPYFEILTKRREEFIIGCNNLTKFIALKIAEINERNETYDGQVGFFSEKFIYELFLSLYDSIIGYDGKIINEYEVRYHLIKDSFLDKIVGGNSTHIENFINKNIFIPSSYITNELEVTLQSYNRRLAKVKKLINEFFPCDINRAEFGWDMHGKWQFHNDRPMKLCAKYIKNSVYHYVFRDEDKEITI